MQVWKPGWMAIATVGFSLMFSPLVLAGQTTVTGPNGRSTTTQTQRQKTETGGTTQRNTTYPDGSNSATSGSWNNNGNGSYSGTVDHTNRQGNTNQYQVEGQVNRGNGSYNNNATVTGPNGQQSTVNTNATYGNGQVNADRAVTYPSGKTRNTQVEGQRTGQGSYTGTVNTTGRNGKTRSGSFQHNR